MKNPQLQQRLALTPLVLVLALSAVYGLFLGNYMECSWAVMGCQKLNVTTIYLPESDVLNKYPEDKTKSIVDVEKQLEYKVRQKEDIAPKRIQQAMLNQELQDQVVATTVALREKAKGLDHSELETDGEFKKLKETLDRVEKQKLETANSLEILDGEEKKLNEDITAAHSRLGDLHKLQIQRHTKRLTWILFSGMFVVACIGALVVALLIIYWIQIESNPLQNPNRKQRTRLLLLLFVGVLVSYSVIRFYIDSNYTSTFESIVSLLENGPITGAVKLINFFDVIGTTIVLALVLTTAIILWHHKSFFDDDTTQFAFRLEQLESRRRYLRLVLYAGTIVLVIGIMRVRVLLDWLLTYSLQSTLQTSVDDFNKVLISSLGVFYTLLLVAVYVPARFIIIDRAQSLTGDTATKEHALQEAGFSSTSTLTFKELLPRIVALMAPFLIGPVAELIKTLVE